MMSYEELRNIFVNILDEKKIKHAWHSFIQLPQGHSFGTYSITESKFDGADDMAMYRHDTISIGLFYRDYKSDGDNALEEDFEEKVRSAENYDKRIYYDSDNELFCSVYTFKCDMQLD